MYKNIKTYCKKVWIDKPDSPSTDSIVVFDGKMQWREEFPSKRESWIEIEGGDSKIRLCKGCEDTNEDYLQKIKTIRDTLNEYILHLMSNIEG